MNLTVVGAAKSGLAAAILAKELGNNVFLTESKPVSEFTLCSEKLSEYGIPFEFGENSAKALKNTECVITSPGVPPTAWLIVEAESRGIPVISELEFACNHLKNPLIAITGTNGKTTTTTLTAYMLNNGGRKAIACGNIGTPLSSLVGKIEPETILVAEVSSFQLDRIINFRPDVAVILNITPDHLYYHGTMEKYIEAKWKISLNQNKKDLLILNYDDPLLCNVPQHIRSQIAWFSLSPVGRGIFTDSGKLKLINEEHKEEIIMLQNEIRLPGVHNAYNSLAAALAARVFEIRNENIRDSLMSFLGVEHRLEFIRELDGVEYINDSKATNVNATWFGLSSYTKPLIWIAGGRGDKNDYSQLDELVEKNVKAIITIGEESDNIFNHFCAIRRCVKESTLESAILKAREFAEAGDIVLFTPACKSFDMFINYEHRGQAFREIVQSL